MADWYTDDGRLNPEAFKAWADIDSFLNAEDAAWNGVASEDISVGARKTVDQIKASLTQVRRTSLNQRQQGYGVKHGFDLLVSKIDNVASTSLASPNLATARFKDIESVVSKSAALFDLGFRRGVVTLADAKAPDDLLAAMWDIAPGLQKTAHLADLLARERANTRTTLRTELERLQQNDARRLDEWDEKLREAKEAYVGWARRRSTRWGRLTRSWDNRHTESERRIRTVEETYREQMGLAAPVEYWNTKATQHKDAEWWARLWVLIFFPTALIGMAIAFNNTAVSLISSAQAAQAPGAAPFPTAVFIVASAGLASCAGLVFWVGRLLTKLYLSQHHLRQDAEERATMTKTYLALIENDAASTDDRQVILNALFRNTPDGIVKEDGGLDPSIAAALGKFLARS